MKQLCALWFSLVVVVTTHAKVVTKVIAYEHEGVKLSGFLAYDDEKSAKGKLPGVLIVHEWWGLNDYAQSRAKQVAKLGYVAFTLDMYGTGITTTDPKKATELSSQFYGKPLMAERARAGLDEFLKTGLVDEHHVAAIGYCFGGTVVQTLAYSGAPLTGIVSFHGSLVPATPETAAKNRASFLICHGAIDPFVPADQVAAFQKSLDDCKVDYQFVSYAGAIHAFTNKGADKIAAATGIKAIAYNAAADRRSWEHMKSFLKEVFSDKRALADAQ